MHNVPRRATADASVAPPLIPKDTRKGVLSLCAKASSKWNANPGRNLVMMFDGTGNILGNHRDTNVVRLMRVLKKDPATSAAGGEQLVYYDPGVGTANRFPASTTTAAIRQFFATLTGLALGSGAFEDIAQGYEFLVHHYQPGDRIFLFGFSRGAFTARALGGMVNAYGLVHPTALSMIPLMVSNYFAKAGKTNKAGREKYVFNNDIIANFALERRPLIHFVGVWDTVETIGSGLTKGVKITNPPTIDDKRFVHVRHALSIHETRSKYSPRMYVDPLFSQVEKVHRSFEERWFPGVHSDIGGSYQRDGLAVSTLQWMADAAIAQGLLVEHNQFVPLQPDRTPHDETYESAYWAWTGLNVRLRPAGWVDTNPVLSLERVRPADTFPRKLQVMRFLGSLLVALMVLLAIGRGMIVSRLCPTNSGVSLWTFFIEQLAPWHGYLRGACSYDNVQLMWRWDLILLVAYCLWLPHPVTWSIRRQARRAIVDGTTLPSWIANAKWIMLILAATAMVEYVMTIVLTSGRSDWLGNAAGMTKAELGLVIIASAKLCALAMLIVLVCKGALTRGKSV